MDKGQAQQVLKFLQTCYRVEFKPDTIEHYTPFLLKMDYKETMTAAANMVENEDRIPHNFIAAIRKRIKTNRQENRLREPSPALPAPNEMPLKDWLKAQGVKSVTELIGKAPTAKPNNIDENGKRMKRPYWERKERERAERLRGIIDLESETEEPEPAPVGVSAQLSDEEFEKRFLKKRYGKGREGID